ncbi:hypothetical protein [Dyella silvae]|uniref:hypothetical protein n=1 Tax=Dyella silvae TaxID=2994424 RepID=UPI002263D3EC|nr:hypothetical protein [Dyella silvae]
MRFKRIVAFACLLVVALLVVEGGLYHLLRTNPDSWGDSWALATKRFELTKFVATAVVVCLISIWFIWPIRQSVLVQGTLYFLVVELLQAIPLVIFGPGMAGPIGPALRVNLVFIAASTLGVWIFRIAVGKSSLRVAKS